MSSSPPSHPFALKMAKDEDDNAFRSPFFTEFESCMSPYLSERDLCYDSNSYRDANHSCVNSLKILDDLTLISSRLLESHLVAKDARNSFVSRAIATGMSMISCEKKGKK